MTRILSGAWEGGEIAANLVGRLEADEEFRGLPHFKGSVKERRKQIERFERLREMLQKPG